MFCALSVGVVQYVCYGIGAISPLPSDMLKMHNMYLRTYVMYVRIHT